MKSNLLLLTISTQILILTTILSHNGDGFAVQALTINKNTVEMLNTGLRALVSIKRILSTIKSVNELSAQAFPGLTANRPKIKFVERLFGKSFGGGGGPSSMSSSASTGISTSATTSASSPSSSHQSKSIGFSSGKRSPSIGMIKIGEKPPPGLFPETMPYSVNGGGSSSAGSPSSSSSSSSSGSSGPFDQNSAETFKFPEALSSSDLGTSSSNEAGTTSGREGRSLFLQSLGILGASNRHFDHHDSGNIIGPFLAANLPGSSSASSHDNNGNSGSSEELLSSYGTNPLQIHNSHNNHHDHHANVDSYESYSNLNFD